MATAPSKAKPKAEPIKDIVAQIKPGELAVSHSMPDFMKGQSGRGVEALSSADFETPRIKLLQALSPEVEEFEEAKAGHFWHSTLNMSLGKEFRFTPIYVDTRFILWRPRPEGGILARSDDGIHWSPANGEFTVKLEKSGKTVTWRTKPTVAASGLADWGSMDPSDPASQPAATKMFNMVLMPADPGIPPGVFTMQRSMISNARKFLGKLKLAGAPSYGTVYTMSSYLDDNSSGQKFHNVKFTPDGFVPDQETFSKYKEMYEGLKAKGLNITDVETLHTDPADHVGETIEGEPAF